MGARCSECMQREPMEATMTTVGLDLHKQYITACAVDADGGVLAEARRLRPELAAAEAVLLFVLDAHEGLDVRRVVATT